MLWPDHYIMTSNWDPDAEQRLKVKVSQDLLYREWGGGGRGKDGGMSKRQTGGEGRSRWQGKQG